MTVSYETPIAAAPFGAAGPSRTARVEILRAQSLATEPSLSAERAELMTEFYRTAPAASTPVLRALAFRHLMERKTIYLGPGELIVGERGPGPKATPTYPELCCHTLEDLEILHTRPRIAYRVSDHVRRTYKDTIIPFWRGRSMRDAIFGQMDEAWISAYEAGVFTEFMEQRAPGHTVLDGKIYVTGMNGFKAIIQRTIADLDFEAYNQLMMVGEPCEPRLADVPVRLPFPAVTYPGQSIFVKQAGLKNSPFRKEKVNA